MREKGRLGNGPVRPAFLLLGAVFALKAAGCGQPPPLEDGQAEGGNANTAETTAERATGGETMAETTSEETTSEKTTGAVAVGGSPELAEAAEGYEEYNPLPLLHHPIHPVI